jgi:hypothetical protein
MGILRFFGYDGSAYAVFRDAFAYLARGNPVKAWQTLRAKMSVFTMANYTTFFLLLTTLAMSVWQARRNAVSFFSVLFSRQDCALGFDCARSWLRGSGSKFWLQVFNYLSGRN